MTARFAIFGKRIGAGGPTTDVEPCPVYPSTKIAPEPPRSVAAAGASSTPTFDDVYDTHFAFVWRNVLNRGVPTSAVDDVVQEVFVVVHRKLAGFEGRSSVRTWLAGIVRRVVADHVRKRGNAPVGDELLGEDSVSLARGPAEELDAKTAARVLDGLLARMPESQREVFILHEVEQMTGREIAEAVGANENTVHTRLRAARRIFEDGLARLRGQAD
jgi:RNA polymerase sigma-70 factor (ECF subfamily)